MYYGPGTFEVKLEKKGRGKAPIQGPTIELWRPVYTPSRSKRFLKKL
jgi:hypothetical protein